MRKEVILAVVIGVLLGVIILYGINLANNASNPNQDDTDEATSKISPSPSKNPDNPLTIILPLENSVVTEGTVSLKGSTKPGSNLAIITESDDILTTADSVGNFSSSINLINGENKIIVTSVDEKQATSSATIYVIRTTSLPE